MTNKELAKKLGVSYHHISFIKNGRRNPSISLLEKTQKVFGLANLDEALTFLRSKDKYNQKKISNHKL